ncbi:hypothetical protein SNE40_019489 [Patella caerulea]|uniref:Uncharacterized protein n=1 Tax=Patella caerulea TaxID=87958 RepID=A0AAN8J9J3_PATCE
MVDFQSRYKIFSYGYVAPRPRPGKPSARQVKHEANRLLAGSYGDRPVHDCRLPSMIEYNDPHEWEAQLLFHGLQQTFHDVEALHYKLTIQAPCSKREPDKLLFQIGIKGNADGDFHFPRDVITTDDGDIIVADTNNHRIQILNQFGVFKTKIGKKGTGNGEFNQPTGIDQLPNGGLVVADSKNRRIQIFSVNGKFKTSFTTKHEPYSVGTDSFKNIVVATSNGTVEIYDRDLKLVKEFIIPGKKSKRCFPKMCTNSNDEIFITDPQEGCIKCVSYNGKLKYQFKPKTVGDGLVVKPSDICFDQMGQLVVSDSLNHIVNVYSITGEFIRQVLTPPDEVGAIFALTVGPEGHLVVAEFALASDHCVKIFRYKKCECHLSRPSSSKRRTPTPFV